MNKYNNQKGQVLLFVVVTMTIALALVSEVTIRNLSSTSQVSNTDSFQRVAAAAESGAERFLKYSDTELEARLGASCNDCEVKYIPSESGITLDSIISKADVTVERYGQTASGSELELEVDSEAISVNLDGYLNTSIRFCWIESTNAQRPTDIATDIKYFAWGKFGTSYSTISGAVAASDRGGEPFNYYQNFDSSTVDASGRDCYTISNLPNAAREIHFVSINGPSKLYVIPQGGQSLPYQGFKITSIGSIDGNNREATKKVVVYRSLAYLPNVFDYAIYSNQNPL